MRSLKYYLLLHSLHRIGDASVKFKRAFDLIHGVQGERSFEEWVEWLDIGCDQFAVDFESTRYPGYMSLSEYKSFLFLHGTNREQFRVVYDEVLRGTPSGRFSDPSTLIRAFQSYAINHKMSISSEPVSQQGSVYLTHAAVPATKQAPPKSTPSAAPITQSQKSDASMWPKDKFGRPQTPRTNSEFCIWCFQHKPGDKKYGHLAVNCHRNPAHPLYGTKATNSAFMSVPNTTAIQPENDRLDQLEVAVSSLVSFLTTNQKGSSMPQPSATSSAFASTFSPDGVPNSITPTDRLAQLEAAVSSLTSLLANKA